MLDRLTQLLWGWHVLLLLLGAGAYFTFATGFYQVRCLGRWLGAALASRRTGEEAGSTATTVPNRFTPSSMEGLMSTLITAVGVK